MTTIEQLPSHSSIEIPTAPPSLPQQIEEIKDLYRKAEDTIKLIERRNSKLSIAPVNELRYAGFHLLNALTVSDKDKKGQELEQAKNHCKRSLYDGIEILILKTLKDIDNFNRTYIKTEIIPTIPNYLELKKEAGKIRDFIEQVVKDNRETYYIECRKNFERLEETYIVFDNAREELNKRLHKDRSDALFKIGGIVVATPAAAIAIYKIISYFLH